MSYVDEASGERCNLALKLPKTQQDWHDKRAYVDAQLNEVGGVVVRVGDETIGELWSLWDGKAVLDEIDPQFSQNVERHIMRALTAGSVPCFGEHRSERRPLQAAAGSGPGHAAPRREGDRCRHRRARRQV